MKSYIKDYDIVENEKEANIIIINSCTVTNGADSDVRNYISKMNRLNKKVILTGCGVKEQGNKMFAENKIFGLFSMDKKNQINDLLSNKDRFSVIGNLNFKESGRVYKFSKHTKAFIKIQEGCNFSCSYCIIPHVRGKSRSIEPEQIIEQIKILISNGFDEIVLTGTNMGSYRYGLNMSFSDLLEKIGTIRGLKRLRLGSLEPSQIDDKFIDILHESWMQKHVHIAIQHSNDEMLKIMHRKNRFKHDLSLFEKIADLGFSIGTDFIVGHPGESDEIWASALDNFKLLPLTHIHSFIYSPRKSTLSATMKHRVNGLVCKERLKLINNIVAINNMKFRQKQRDENKTLQILIEQKKGDYYTGFDEYYNKCFIKKDIIDTNWLKADNYECKFEGNFIQF